MNSRQYKQSKTLAEWLAIATERLCEDARSRVTFEIETHFNEAVDFHQTEGKSLVEAQGIALEELGGPLSAARRFRKKHLTQRQLEKLRAYEQAGQKLPSLLITWLFSGSLIEAFSGRHEHKLAQFAIDFVAWLPCVLVPWIRYGLHRLHPDSRKVRSFILVSEFICGPFYLALKLYFVTFLMLITVMVVFGFSSNQLSYNAIAPALRWLSWFFVLLMLLPFLAACGQTFYWMRVWQKVRNDLLHE